MAIDPITASVIEAGVAASADEMFAVLKKTAMSPISYEALAVGAGDDIPIRTANGGGWGAIKPDWTVRRDILPEKP